MDRIFHRMTIYDDNNKNANESEKSCADAADAAAALSQGWRAGSETLNPAIIPF